MKKVLLVLLAFMLTFSSYAASHKGKRVPMRRSVQSVFAGLTQKRTVSQVPVSIYIDGNVLEIEMQEDAILAVATFKDQNGEILHTVLLASRDSEVEVPEGTCFLEVLVSGKLYVGELF